MKDVPIDVGVLQYYYPGSYPDGYTRPHTTEGYAQIGYGPVSFKYSHAFSTCSVLQIATTASTSTCRAISTPASGA